MTGKAVQQMMLGKVLRTEEQTAEILGKIRYAGYDGIELCGYMTRRTPLFVRMLTAAFGMPAGRGGAFDWAGLCRAAKLRVVALHEDIGTLEKDPDAAMKRAEALGTRTLVITGLYRFDYTDPQQMARLSVRLNALGRTLKDGGFSLLYHNHNVELCRVGDTGERAYALLIRATDPDALGFEFDSYWFAEAGASPAQWMKALGPRMRLWHINDRGTRPSGVAVTPILKSDCTELGFGNMDLDALTALAKESGVEAVVLETHRNHIDGDPVKSLMRSAAYLNRSFPS